MKIYLYIKEVYGKPQIYPCGDCARLVNNLTGKKTVDQKDIDALTGLGVDCEFVSNPEYAQTAGQVKELYQTTKAAI